MKLGKFRAKVVNNQDPKNMSRIQVECPKIYGSFISPWCLPCLPYAVNNINSIVPPINSMVWIEFEEGDTNKPIWTGCIMKPNEKIEWDTIELKTKNGLHIVLSNDTVKISKLLVEGDLKVQGSLVVDSNLNVSGSTTMQTVNCGTINSPSIHYH